MRESIGTIWITGLVITFMLIFVGYLTFSISYSDTVRTKNEILTIIERRSGITSIKPTEELKKSFKPVESQGKYVIPGDNVRLRVNFGTLQSINLYLTGRGYKNKGNCTVVPDETWYGVDDLKLDTSNYIVNYETVKPNKKYYYCFTKDEIPDNGRAAYYRIKVFYKFDLPIISAMLMPIDGKTNTITIPSYCEISEYNKTGFSLCPIKQERRV